MNYYFRFHPALPPSQRDRHCFDKHQVTTIPSLPPPRPPLAGETASARPRKTPGSLPHGAAPPPPDPEYGRGPALPPRPPEKPVLLFPFVPPGAPPPDDPPAPPPPTATSSVVPICADDMANPVCSRKCPAAPVPPGPPASDPPPPPAPPHR